jgi:hypothetical protein
MREVIARIESVGPTRVWRVVWPYADRGLVLQDDVIRGSVGELGAIEVNVKDEVITARVLGDPPAAARA